MKIILLIILITSSVQANNCFLKRTKSWNPSTRHANIGKNKYVPIAKICNGKAGRIVQDKTVKDWFWSEIKDTAHAGCAWKILKHLGNDEYSVHACADETGTIIKGKHESGSLKKITCK